MRPCAIYILLPMYIIYIMVYRIYCYLRMSVCDLKMSVEGYIYKIYFYLFYFSFHKNIFSFFFLFTQIRMLIFSILHTNSHLILLNIHGYICYTIMLSYFTCTYTLLNICLNKITTCNNSVISY